MPPIRRTVLALLALVSFLAAGIGVRADTYDTHLLVQVHTRSEADVQVLYDYRIDIVGRRGDVYRALVTPKDLAALRKNRLEVQVLWEEMAAERDARAIPGGCGSTSPPCYYEASTFDLSSPPSGSLMEKLLQLQQSHSSITRLFDIGDSYSGNFDIIAMKVTDNPDTVEAEPKIRIYGNIHGDEVAGLMISVDVLEWILDNYPSDPAAQKLVDEAELWFIPMGNPDGNDNQSRYNGNSVDLNRNFWGPAGSDDGAYPFSEPETQAIRDLTEVMGKRFANSLSFHGGATCFNSVYNYTSTATPDEPIFFSSRTGGPYGEATPAPDGLAEAYQDGCTTSGFWYTNGADWYITHGDTNDWSYAIWSDLDTTLEATSIKWPNASQIPVFQAEHRQATLNYMLKTFQGIHGIMTDADTGTPLDGTVIATATWSPNIPVPHLYKEVFTDPLVGDYHRVLQPGTYTVECRAPGYAPSVTTGLSVTADTTTPHDCQLTCVPLTISSVQVSAISDDAATITWQTNTDADSTLTFGATVPPSTVLYDADTTTSHAVTISGLSPCTDYFFTVASGSSGCSFAVDDNQGAYHHLETWEQTAVFSDDMESGSSLWSPDAPWAISGEEVHGGAFAWSDSPGGNYGNNLNVSLRTVPFDLSGVASATLTFWHKYDLESGWDYGYLEVSANGTNWSQLDVWDGLQSSWVQESYDLSAYLGDSSVYIRFRLDTDTSVTRDGWHIDDVKIGPPATPCPATVAPAPDGSSSTVPLTATRLDPAGNDLALRWGVSCASTDYQVLYGSLANVTSYGLDGARCQIGPSGVYDWLGTGSGSLWFLIVGTDGASTESSWGTDSSGAERNGTAASGQCGMTVKDTAPTCP